MRGVPPAGRRRNVVSSASNAVVSAARADLSTRGRPWVSAAAIAADHDTQNALAAPLSETPLAATILQICPALTVYSPPGWTCGDCSVHVLMGQSGSKQR
jgi:hypothetical protein